MIKHTNDPEKIFHLGKRELRSVEGIGEASALSVLSFDDWDKVNDILTHTVRNGSEIVTLADPEYPDLLKQIYDPPILFWIKGNAEILKHPGVAVVGTRNTSPYGRKMAKKFTGNLADKDLCIFSGLASGIDSIAHRTALEHNGKTVAVLGSGIDNLYPRENASLANDIVKSGGAVITEYPLGTKPDAGNFPVRNRIVSGMSLGVLVIESGIKGGSMITADIGLDQNREVFALPHPVLSPSGTGCNYLIKRGAAKLVQTVDDILEELPVGNDSDRNGSIVQEKKKKDWRKEILDERAKKICEILEEKAHQVDDLSDKVGMDTSQLLVTLLQLEMEDIVSQKAGKIFELK
ncbi:DNA-processing protein DprA [Gracilimonas sp. Q87]|uniref:DNA-processing protein DprA n=1 Tax=Gracilimonas sp. Q87 TaxID=3384766 RepID=UPI0039840310